MRGQQVQAGAQQTLLLAVIDAGRAAAIVLPAAKAHFGHHQCAFRRQRHQVKLTHAAAVVAQQDAVAPRAEEVRRRLFGRGALRGA